MLGFLNCFQGEHDSSEPGTGEQAALSLSSFKFAGLTFQILYLIL